MCGKSKNYCQRKIGGTPCTPTTARQVTTQGARTKVIGWVVTDITEHSLTVYPDTGLCQMILPFKFLKWGFGFRSITSASCLIAICAARKKATWLRVYFTATFHHHDLFAEKYKVTGHHVLINCLHSRFVPTSFLLVFPPLLALISRKASFRASYLSCIKRFILLFNF